jgi:hypothetical protein
MLPSFKLQRVVLFRVYRWALLVRRRSDILASYSLFTPRVALVALTLYLFSLIVLSSPGTWLLIRTIALLGLILQAIFSVKGLILLYICLERSLLPIVLIILG